MMTHTTSNNDEATTVGMGRWSNDDEWLDAEFSLTSTAIGIQMTADGPDWSWVVFDVISAVDQIGNDNDGLAIVEFFSADGLVVSIRTPTQFLDRVIGHLVESRAGTAHQGEAAESVPTVPSVAGELDSLRTRMASLCDSGGNAIQTTEYWVVNGSRSEGDKVLTEMSRLVLRMYNVEADHLVRELPIIGLDTALGRLEELRDSISELGRAMELSVSNEYHGLRCDELKLASGADVSDASARLSSV